MKLHIAETFHSLKGEGLYYGVPMFFVRFAGCNVGKRGPADMMVRASKNPSLNVLGTTCTAYDGRQFGCDTDYKSYETLDLDNSEDVDHFFAQIWEPRVVLTGGEPMSQPRAFLKMVAECNMRGKTPHVETSGTVDIILEQDAAWVACAPKEGYFESQLWRANEIKLLVDENFNMQKVPKPCFEHPLVFVCPINDGATNNFYGEQDKLNLELCQSIVKLQPNWRVGVQLHKLLGIR